MLRDRGRSNQLRPTQLNNKKLRELRDAHAKLLKQMRALHEKAEREDRAFTAEEQREWDRLDAETDTLAQRIDRAARMDSLDSVDPETRRRTSGIIDSGGEDRDAGRESGWVDREGKEVRVFRPGQSVRASLRDTYDPQEWRGLTFGGFLRSLVSGPQNDVERRALALSAGASGGFTVPTPLALEAIDRLRARAVVMRAGARTVQMDSATLSMARLDSDPTAAWKAENASITDADVTFGQVQLTARTLVALVKASRELVMDSANVGEVLVNAFGQALALELDRAALLGSGTAPEPRGLMNISGVNQVSMGTDGGNLTGYNQLMDLVLALANANAELPTAYVMAPRTNRRLNGLVDLEGHWLPPPAYIRDNASRGGVLATEVQSASGLTGSTWAPAWLETTAIPINQTVGTSTDCSTLFTGYFPEMLVGLRMGLTIEVFREAFAGNYQLGFLASMRADVQVQHPASFGRLIGIRHT